MIEGVDYLGIGKPGAGSDCIEGLVPETIVSSVYSKEIALVRAASSSPADVRKSAKNSLKAKLFNAMKDAKLDESEFADFKKIFAALNKGLKKS